ncbi:hypothetical protein [Streptomyces sp. NPDC049040]|uniref:hypothetical protein n=1 Tax=Streptomyces sp. NPDC049040 TaxID=3365593 RepID=UPI0037163489
MTVPSVRRLAELVPPGDGAGDRLDWARLKQEYGHGFPADYRDFVAVFGEGSFNTDAVMVAVPRTAGAAGWRVGRIPAETVADPDMQSWRQPGPRHHLGGILVWGGTDTADVLGWLTEDPDPDTWPVAVWSRDTGEWALYEGGMADFLVRLFSAGHDTNPIGTNVGGGGPLRFLNAREEARLTGLGLNPWTGEPDPFAGVTYD